MTDSCNIPHPLKREGTYQFERFPLPLGNDYVQLDERTLADLLKQSAEFARFVNYYSAQNIQDGDWTPFFAEIYDYDTKTLKFKDIFELEGKGNTSPHIALFIAFLHLLNISQANLNSLTQKHLDFYYKVVLQLDSLDEQPDKVAVAFELDKNNQTVLVPKGTSLLAGKDGAGKDVFFTTDDDIVVNNAAVAEVRTVFLKKDVNGVPLDVYISNDAVKENIVDPISPLPAWYTFGSLKSPFKAAVGFAIASPMFNLPEGKRRITIQFSNFRNVDKSVLVAYYTTAKGWAKAIVDVPVPGKPEDPYNPASPDFLMLKLSPIDPPMVPYIPAIHGVGAPPNFLANTIHPVIQITISTADEMKFRDTYATLKKVPASNVKIVVNVSGVRNLIVQNDVGLLDPTKPFYPFGTQPSKGKSTLFVGCYEAFNKYLFSFHLSIDWNGIPGNLQKYYSGYELLNPPLIPHEPPTSINIYDYDRPQGPVLIRQDWTFPFVAHTESRQNARSNKFMNQWNVPFRPGHPPGDLYILDNGTWKLIKLNFGANYLNRGRKKKQNTTNTYKNYIPVTSKYEYGSARAYSPRTSWGFVKIQLGYDFGHLLYPKLIHTVALNSVAASQNQQKPPSVTLPNQPYTPSFKSLHLDYVSVGTLDFKDNTEHQFFHIHPFGSEEIVTNKYHVVPDFIYEGTLYIGLSGISFSENINLYFQFLEGTGNPDKEISDANKVVWSYLSGNTWQLLDENALIVKDTTLNFSSSGFIIFKIQPDALLPHTILTNGLVWLRASVIADADVYPYTLGIKSQVIQATYDKRGNDPYRLLTPLPPGSIAKLETKIAGVKNVSQPYSSYDGFISEQSGHFYTRVSERLRHKGRPWSIWDYERIVLQQFPAIYKTKCISHSDTSSEYAPGDVLIVILPNPENVNYQDILQPKLGKRVTEAVKSYLGDFISPFVNVNVVNPTYELLKVTCDVKIKAGFDEYYYREQLKKEITEYLAPWSVPDTANHHEKISFEGRIFKSQIVNFIEQRPYIDYVTTIDVFKKLSKFVKCDEMITASNEHSILTSVTFDQHEVKTSAVC
jgi:hypothetical protein